MINMTNLIKQLNARVLKNQEHTEKGSYNGRVKDNCPLDGKCLRECVVYQANVMFTLMYCISSICHYQQVM